MTSLETRIYRNRDVEAVYAYVPPGHRHVRFALKTRDQVIVLQEATVAGLVRAYAWTVLHPSNKAAVLRVKKLPPEKRKPGYAEHQAMEEALGEKALRIIMDELEVLGISSEEVKG